MEKYSPDTLCVKCGLPVRFSKVGWNMPWAVGLLYCECGTCGHTWTMLPLDADGGERGKGAIILGGHSFEEWEELSDGLRKHSGELDMLRAGGGA